jgi:hypothetical protein
MSSKGTCPTCGREWSQIGHKKAQPNGPRKKAKDFLNMFLGAGAKPQKETECQAVKELISKAAWSNEYGHSQRRPRGSGGVGHCIFACVLDGPFTSMRKWALPSTSWTENQSRAMPL